MTQKIEHSAARRAAMAEVADWCDAESGKIVSYEGGSAYRRVADYCRAQAIEYDDSVEDNDD